MNGPAEHFIYHEQGQKCSRIWICNYQLYAKTSSLIMQDLSMSRLTPHVLVQPHSSMGDTPCMWSTRSAKWHSIFSQRDCSLVFDTNYQKICLACAHVYVGCNTVRMNIPQKVIVVESQVWYARYCFFIKSPSLGSVTMSKYLQYPQLTEHLPFVWHQIWVLGPLLCCFCLRMLNQKVESALAIT